jgi:tRNA-dihydrouridine synthase A
MRRLSVAPMMDWTDRFCRRFHRVLTRRALLYTEMVPTGAILRGQRERFLAFDPVEKPLALQLGGADPVALAECAAIAEDWGYDEVNLNVGCPSDRVQNARFGACLMAEPKLVARCVEQMQAATDIPVTVKHRIGIDEQDSYEELKGFVATVAAVGCRSFTVHARKAWLQGLSPKQNREIPPLRYEMVQRLKQDFPELEIVINGGITSLEVAAEQLRQLDGVMLGRAAYQDPWVLAEVDSRIFGEEDPVGSRAEAVQALLPWLKDAHERGVPVKAVTRHVLGLFNGLPGARTWRRHLSEKASRQDAGPEIVEEALAYVEAAAERRAA